MSANGAAIETAVITASSKAVEQTDTAALESTDKHPVLPANESAKS